MPSIVFHIYFCNMKGYIIVLNSPSTPNTLKQNQIVYSFKPRDTNSLIMKPEVSTPLKLNPAIWSNPKQIEAFMHVSV